jgi:hypothetical protein
VGICASLCIQAVDLCRKIVFDVKSDSAILKKIFIGYIIFLQLVAVCVFGAYKLYGTKKDSYTCWFSDYGDDKFQKFIILWIMQINLMIAVVAFIMICGKATIIMRQLLKTSRNNEENDGINQRLSTMLSLFMMPLCCLLTFLVIWTFVMYGTYEESSRRQIYEKSLNEWVNCVFKNFGGTRSWESTCGIHAKERVNMPRKYLIFSMGLCGHSIFVACFILAMSSSSFSFTKSIRWLITAIFECFRGGFVSILRCWNDFVDNGFSEFFRPMVNSEKFDYMKNPSELVECDQRHRHNDGRIVPEEDELNQFILTSSITSFPVIHSRNQLRYTIQRNGNRSSKLNRLNFLRSMIVSKSRSSSNPDELQNRDISIC